MVFKHTTKNITNIFSILKTFMKQKPFGKTNPLRRSTQFCLSWMRGNHQTQHTQILLSHFFFHSKSWKSYPTCFSMFFKNPSKKLGGSKNHYFFHYGFLWCFFRPTPKYEKKTHMAQDVALGKFTISTKISVGPKIRPPPKNFETTDLEYR